MPVPAAIDAASPGDALVATPSLPAPHLEKASLDRLSTLPPETVNQIYAFAGPGRHLYLSKALLPAARGAQFRSLQVCNERTLRGVARLFSERPYLAPLVRELDLLIPAWAGDENDPLVEFDEDRQLLSKDAAVFDFLSGLVNLRHLTLNSLETSIGVLLSPAVRSWSHLASLYIRIEYEFVDSHLATILGSFAALDDVVIRLEHSFSDREALHPVVEHLHWEWFNATYGPSSDAPLSMPSVTAHSLSVMLYGPTDQCLSDAAPFFASFTRLSEATLVAQGAGNAVWLVIGALPLERVEKLMVHKSLTKADAPLDGRQESQLDASSVERLRGAFSRLHRVRQIHLAVPLPSAAWRGGIPSRDLNFFVLAPEAWPSPDLLLPILLPRLAPSPSLPLFQLANSSLSLCPPTTPTKHERRLDAEGYAAARRYLRWTLRPGGLPNPDEQRVQDVVAVLDARGWKLPEWRGPHFNPVNVGELLNRILDARLKLPLEDCHGPRALHLVSFLHHRAVISFQELVEEVQRYQEAQRAVEAAS
ncbi:hypothetical protein JCM10213_006953 [Rhodosporidiobolus nylandii]